MPSFRPQDEPVFSQSRLLREAKPSPTPEAKPARPSKWPPTRVLGGVIAIGALTVVVNLSTVAMIAVYFHRISVRQDVQDARLADVEGWITHRQNVMAKNRADAEAFHKQFLKESKESEEQLTKLKADVKRYNAAGGVTGEVLRDLAGKSGSPTTP